MDRPTSSGIWPTDRDFILRGLGENPVRPGGTVYVDFHFEFPFFQPPKPEQVSRAQQAEADLKACLVQEMPREYQPRIERRGAVVRFTYRKPAVGSRLGVLDQYLPLCIPDRPWAIGTFLVEFGQVLDWWEYPLPAWAVALAVAATMAIGWELGRRSALGG